MMKLKYWAIIILATLAVCAGVFYYLKQPAPDLGPITVHHLSHIQPQIDASNWQIIRNDQPGYQLKLPPGWKLNHASSLPDFFAVYQSVPDAAWAEGVGVPDNGLWVEVSYSGASCERPDTVYVNEQDVANITDKNVCRGLFGVDVGFWNGDPNKVADKNLLNMILDTFQPIPNQTPTATSSSAENNATSSSIDMSGWKIYTNSQYGFSLDFPPDWSHMKVENDGLSFDLPYADTGQFTFVCGLQVYSSADWGVLQNSDAPHPTEVTGTDKEGYIYSYQCGQDDEGYAGFEQYNQAVESSGDRSGNGPYKEFKEMVLPTFKFTN